MREKLVCPKCKHNHILLVAGIPDIVEPGLAPWYLKVAVVPAPKGFLEPETKGAGHLAAAVCKRCGYTELYTLDPQSIPVDGKHVREAVGPEPEQPYR